MKYILRINCREVYATGISIDNNVSLLNDSINRIKEINESISSAWEGMDYQNFKNNFNSYLNNLDKLKNKLTTKSEILKQAAMKHGKVDLNLKSNMKRGIENE